LIRRLVFRCLRIVYQRLLRWDTDVGPWERVWYRPPADRLGSRQDFGWYMRGESTVAVASLEEICDWLLSCSYAGDRELFGENEHWQHPTTFERLRRGDCEDHALWAWRKLVELGVDADFVVGRILHAGDKALPAAAGGHAWVLLRRDGVEWLFETVAKSREALLRRLDEVKSDYRPEFGVDRQLRTFSFAGVTETQYEQVFGRRRPLAPANER
jgi:hypothetical protein